MAELFKKYGWPVVLLLVAAIGAALYFAWSWIVSWGEEQGLSLSLESAAQAIIGAISLSSTSDATVNTGNVANVTGYSGPADVTESQARVLAYRSYLVGIGWVPCCRDEEGLKAQIAAIIENPATAYGQYSRTG